VVRINGKREIVCLIPENRLWSRLKSYLEWRTGYSVVVVVVVAVGLYTLCSSNNFAKFEKIKE
jgi:hypothetical protein